MCLQWLTATSCLKGRTAVWLPCLLLLLAALLLLLGAACCWLLALRLPLYALLVELAPALPLFPLLLHGRLGLCGQRKAHAPRSDLNHALVALLGVQP